MTNRSPAATAKLAGSDQVPALAGDISFYAAPGGTIVSTRVDGLPPISLPAQEGQMQVGPFGLRIHKGTDCETDTGAQAFSDAGGHYNPTDQPHPLHAGDWPVLFPNDIRSEMLVYTKRFKPQDVAGRTVVIHQMPDDFHSQPAGDAGMRIGCGVIRKP